MVPIKTLAILFLLTAPARAALDTFWVGDGSFKMARQDKVPLGFSSNTWSVNWDGHTATPFGGRNETIGMVLYMGSDGSNSTEVTVAVSSLTGPSGAGIVSVDVSSSNVFDWENRPIEVFYARYLEITGMSQLQNDPTEYDAYHYPRGFRRPCTIIGDRCVPDGGTGWTDRPDRNKFFPEILVPYEAVRASSFTVAASSSQAIWIDIYIGKDKPAGTYAGEIVVREGVSVSTRIPVSLTVKDFELPDQANFHMIGFMSGYDINYRHHGTHTPDATGEHLTVRNRYRQMLKRHKFSSSIGEDVQATNAPKAEHIARLNGSLFSNASGYYNAPGEDTPDPYFSIGTYGSWQGTWSGATTSASTLCTRINAYADWFATNSPDTISFLYLTDEPSDLTDTNKWSTWISTSCAHASGYRVKSMVTASHVSVNSGATYLEYPMSTTHVNASSATIDLTVSSYTTNQGRAWYYNSYSPWTGWATTEADGYEPREIPWGGYKKNVMGWFYWDTTHFTDDNQSFCRADVDNDLFADARTFGCDGTFNSTKGITGFNYANGDGVLMYPGEDVVGSVDYELDGPMASWRLKMFRRGIQDADYLTLAEAVDSEATQDVLDEIVGGRVMWEYQCVDIGDCTYAYGPKGYSENAADYEAQRLVLANILDGSDPFVPGTVNGVWQGGVILQGGVALE